MRRVRELHTLGLFMGLHAEMVGVAVHVDDVVVFGDW